MNDQEVCFECLCCILTSVQALISQVLSFDSETLKARNMNRLLLATTSFMGAEPFEGTSQGLLSLHIKCLFPLLSHQS